MTMPYTGSFCIASAYGNRIDPITGVANTFHGGLDLVGEDKTVLSVTDGYVAQSQIVTDPSNRTSEWGNYVAIVSQKGEIIYYCHLAKRLVSIGESVKAGQPIGIEGTTGRSTGSHLHFEVRTSNIPQNAADYLNIPNRTGYEFTPEISTDTAVILDNTPSNWSKDAILWAMENSIVRGDEQGNLKLHSPCTREEMLVFIHRFAKLYKNKS